jgi:hypothetical protein
MTTLEQYGYFQAETRALVHERRRQLLGADPEVLAAAKEVEMAAAAMALKAAGAPAAAPRPALCEPADLQMDQAAELLSRHHCKEAVPLLMEAAKIYRQAGPPAEWDLADALGNLGYALFMAERKGGSKPLAEAELLLAKQARLADLARCVVSFACTALQQERPRQAFKRLRLADGIAQLLNDLVLQAEIQWLTGDCLLAMNLPALAVLAYGEGIQSSPETHRRLSAAQQHCRAGLQSLVAANASGLCGPAGATLEDQVKMLLACLIQGKSIAALGALMVGLQAAVFLEVNAQEAKARLRQIALAKDELLNPSPSKLSCQRL